MLNQGVCETMSKDVPADDVNFDLPSNHSQAAMINQDKHKTYNTDASDDNVVTKLPPSYSEVTMLNQGVCETMSKDVPVDDVNMVNIDLPSNHSEAAITNHNEHKTYNTDVSEDSVVTKLSSGYSEVTVLDQGVCVCVCETMSKAVPVDNADVNLPFNHSEAATTNQVERKTNIDMYDNNVVTKLPSSYNEVTMLNQGVCETGSKDVLVDDVNINLPSNHSDPTKTNQD